MEDPIDPIVIRAFLGAELGNQYGHFLEARHEIEKIEGDKVLFLQADIKKSRHYFPRI